MSVCVKKCLSGYGSLLFFKATKKTAISLNNYNSIKDNIPLKEALKALLLGIYTNLFKVNLFQIRSETSSYSLHELISIPQF